MVGTCTVPSPESSESISYSDNPDNDNDLPMVPDHGGQDFCECYEADLDAFCDGIVGCLAREMPLVKVVIAAHCAYETGTASCD